MKKIITNRFLHAFFLSFLLLYAVLGLDPEGETRQRFQFLVFDQYTKIKPRPATDDVKIVDIDDESLAHIGQWPWPRVQVADLITTLTALGAKVIAFDGVLAEPDRTSPVFFWETLPDGALKDSLSSQKESLADYDHILAQAIKESGVFVSAFTHGSNEKRPRIVNSLLMRKDVKAHFLQESEKFQKTALFLPALEKSAAGNGSFMARPEIDGLIRKTGLLFSDGKTLYPSLNLEALRVWFKPKNIFIKVDYNKNFNGNKVDTPYRIFVGEKEVPVDREGNVWVYFRTFDRDKDYISAHKVLNPSFHEEIRKKVAGKILFIGSTAEGLKDLRATPHDAFLPGVEIHANVTEQFLQDTFLLRPKVVVGAEGLFMLGIGVIIILLTPFIGAVGGLLISALFIGLSFYGSWFYFDEKGILLDPVYPSLAIILLFIISSTLNYIRAETERKQVRQAFGLYISPDFMKELTKNPDKLRLGGELRDLTIMFSDIRNFTTISESLTPKELTRLMNDFLTPMSDVVMESRGTIDKYMGDAMMAFWNAPLDDEAHARHACEAALRMSAALAPLNEMLAARAAEEGKTPIVLNAGIGINTGPASVGNMGSKQRFAYSVLGDAVNLASRLEGQTKAYGVDILIGENTNAQVPDMATMELDLIRVKGKTEPVRVFALLGDTDRAAEEGFKAWRVQHDDMMAAYRTGDFDRAEVLIEECRKLSSSSRGGAADAAIQNGEDTQDSGLLRPDGPRNDGVGNDLSAFYDMFTDRISDLKETPPANWDGVYIATSK